MSGPGEGTWRCHVCGDERPDAQISVYSEDAPSGHHGVNVRYCNDRQRCIDDAPLVAARWLSSIGRKS